MHVTAFPVDFSTGQPAVTASRRPSPGLGHWKRSLGIMAASVFALTAPTVAAETTAALTVSGPHVQDNLAVYFIHGKSRKGPVPLTLAEAMRQDRVTVHETGRVQQLLIENTGDKEVFVQAGDIVKGGRQDRVLTISLLLPPRSGKISIGSYCVEQGRWSRRGGESDKRFSSAESSMPSRAAKIAILSAKPSAASATGRVPTLGTGLLLAPPPASGRLIRPNVGDENRSNRQRILRNLERRRYISRSQPSRQQEVWRNVAEIQRKLSDNLAAGVRSAKSQSSLQLSLENQKLVEARAKMTTALQPLGIRAKDVVGYAFAINGRINSAEIYPSNGLFAKMWPKLLKASVTEAIAEKGLANAAADAPRPTAIKSFLDAASKGEADTATLHNKLQRERRETKKALSLATRRGDGSVVHHSLLAR